MSHWYASKFSPSPRMIDCHFVIDGRQLMWPPITFWIRLLGIKLIIVLRMGLPSLRYLGFGTPNIPLRMAFPWNCPTSHFRICLHTPLSTKSLATDEEAPDSTCWQKWQSGVRKKKLGSRVNYINCRDSTLHQPEVVPAPSDPPSTASSAELLHRNS